MSNAREPRTILVVEGDDARRASMRRLLELRGFRVLEASDSEEATLVNIAHPRPIHALVAGRGIPVDAARWLRSMRPDMRVLNLVS